MRKIQSEGNGRSIADYLSPKGSIVKDVIPLGLPGPKPSPAASYLQVTPMKPSQPRGCLSNPNTHPLPKRVPPLTSPGLNPVRAKPSPGPHPPQLPGVHHRASGGGGGDEAKDGKANLTNPITRKIQTSHSPVTSNPSRSITLDPRVGTGSGNSNVGSSSALFTAGLPLQSTPQYTAGDDRKDTMKNGCPLSHTMFSPVNPQQSGGSLDHRGTTQTSKLFTSGTKSLSQKRGRNPDLEERTKGEEMANKKQRPEDYRPNSSPAPICTSHPSYGTASPSYLKKVFMKNSLNSGPILSLKERLTPKKTEGGMARGMEIVPTSPLPTPKPVRQVFNNRGQPPCRNSVRENSNPQCRYSGMNHQSVNPQSVYSGSNLQSGHPANLPVKSASRGECSRGKEGRASAPESRGREATGRPDRRTPKPVSRSHSSYSSCSSSLRHLRLAQNRNVTRPRGMSALPDDLIDLFTPDPITSSLSRAATFSSSPQRGGGSPSVHKVLVCGVSAKVCGASKRLRPTSVTSPREIPQISPLERISGPNIFPCKVAAVDPSKLLLGPNIYSPSFLRLESCGTDLTKLKTASYRTITCTSSGKPSSPKDESVTMEDDASKLKTSPTFPAVRLFADESVKTEAGPRSPGIPSAGLESPMDEHANLNNESSALKTIPLSASAKSSSLCKDELFNMGTADFKASTRSPFLPSPTSRLDRKGKEGEKRKEGDQKSLSFLEEGEKRSKMDNPQKSLIFLEEDPLDVELGLGLDLGLELELSQASSSSSSEDELPSLQQILDRTARPPDTPEKGTFTAPSTPVGPRHHSQLPVTSKAKPTSYRNNLDEMLKEKESIQRSKEMETKLRLSCEENLLRLAEEEEEDESAENMEAAISHQQREFLQRFSVVSSAIRDLHPGEAMFSLDNFGRLFSQHTLQLRHCNVSPRDTAQKTLLWSTPDQFRSHVSSELIQRAYRSSPCPPQVARWLFQMVSVHSDKLTCHQVLKALKDIACSAAEHMMLNKNERFEVWVPSVGDVTLVFMNMGVPFVTLFPLENLQPPFTEGDLLEGFQISTESLSSKKELSTFPEHNFDSVIKYLSHCTSLCPRAYSDGELLLLLTVVSRVGLDTQLTLQPTEHLRSLLRNLISSIRDWDVMLPRICMSLIDLSDDHHNLRWLVQLLPDNIRGKQLRRHLSVSAISKLLNIRCTYRPSNTEFQLSDLRRYLPRMRPSSLLRGLATSFRRSQNAHREREEEEEDCASLDQQAYYLCYSLLALANEATNFEFFPPEQKNQLLLLCAELEKHIKCDIRESEKMLYRSKVKDFVARIYTKWQVLVQRTRPLQGKLYDYWQPLPEDAVSSSQESKHSHREREEEREDEETVMELEGEGVEGKGEDEERIAEKALSMEDERRETPEKYLAMEDEEGKVVKGEEEDKEERIAEKALAMEKEILGGEEKLLKMDELEEEEEERMELTLEESGEERKMEDMEEKWTVVKAEERVTEKREAAAVEEGRKGPTEGETEERGNLEKDSEMEEKGEE
ncbi:SMC5-SMC6 complex localization factor protein 2-like isoform X2 [Oncorhynchus clarkii lewisi]|uniref:SMC5-SMC6 complex localization factor protein 2-like isoform X2 n=2 Tax=Oncorhynchus clarkii lewisi TaxID=490388 RepID=UPI0039B8753D